MDIVYSVKSQHIFVEEFSAEYIKDIETKFRKPDVLSVTNYGIETEFLGDIMFYSDLVAYLKEQGLKVINEPYGTSVQSYKFIIKFKSTKKEVAIHFYNKQMADDFVDSIDSILL